MAIMLGKLQARIRQVLRRYAEKKTRITLAWDEPGLHEAYAELLAYGHALVSEAEFTSAIEQAAQSTAGSVRAQVATALGLSSLPAHLASQIDKLVADMRRNAERGVVDSLERAHDVLQEWDDLDPETSDRADDPDALDAMLVDGLDGITGSALQSSTLAFGFAFAAMNMEAQVSAGAREYIWVSQHDGVARPAHRALDEKVCNWDDPPLSADESSSGEPCHAGEDYNCRCLAAPLG